MDAMLALIDPAYRQRDHRPVTMSGETRDEWRQLFESWWATLPDVRMDAVRMLREDGDRALYLLDASGTDPTTGGRVEFAVYVANRFGDGRFLEGHLFDDEAKALAFFDDMEAR